MKIVYLVPRSTYELKMSRVRFQQMHAIGERVPVVITGPGFERPILPSHRPSYDMPVECPAWESTFSPAENVARIRIGDDRAELVVVYGVEDLAGMHCPIATQYNEADDVLKVSQYVSHNRISLVVFHHQNDTVHYPWPSAAVEAVHIPHCADTRVCRDWSENARRASDKPVDILVAGNMSQFFYPFRFRLRGLALGWFKKRGYRVRVLDHPGYTLPPRDGTLIGEAFARAINDAKLVFTCSMRFNYALAKYSEIAACRSLAVGDLPGERHEHFAKSILNVEPWMTDEQITRKIEDVLDDESGLLHTLTEESYDRSRAYTMGKYAQRFLAAAKEHLHRKGVS